MKERRTTVAMGTTREAHEDYRNPRLSVDHRVDDLLARMTLAEKAGILFQTMIVVGSGDLAEPNSAFGVESAEHMINDQQLSHFNVVRAADDARALADWHNRLQMLAASTRLGVPITLSTDPRNHFTENVGTAARAGTFSQWPETLGFAAIGSSELVERFADIARQEYLAVGLRLALHPQIDLATEPRWSRISGSFGEDADLTSRLVQACIRGFQSEQLGPESVSTMTKHFPGGGPQQDGEDPHFAYGREQVYPGNNFEYHLKPFRAAIAAGAAQIMPYYGMPVDIEYDEVAFAFNKGIITDLLREKLGFDGIICTDWGLVTDTTILGQPMPARAWGVEHLDELSRVEMILNAGCDQLGGEARPELVVRLVEQGRISEQRLDVSVRRLLREKFTLGLFDDPYLDLDHASATVGKAEFVAAGADAQRRAYTLLTNHDQILPLEKCRRLYLEGVRKMSPLDMAMLSATQQTPTSPCCASRRRTSRDRAASRPCSTPDRWSFPPNSVIITPRSARRYLLSSMSTLIVPPCSPTWPVRQPHCWAVTGAATRPSSMSSSESPIRRVHFPSTCPDPWLLWKPAAPTSRLTPWTRSSDSVTDCATANRRRAVRRPNALRFHGG
jgi:beta-glucosidase